MHTHKELAPVTLFVYNRPEHTRQTLEHLSANDLAKQTVLYVFADGPKPGATHEEKKKIEDTRQLVKTLTGFKDVVLIEKEVNQGLAPSVIAGVTEIINKHGKVIVLEDDLLVSPFFLDFMNRGLDQYEDSYNVYSINGFMFPLNHDKYEVTLLPFTSTWGWATWKHRWAIFDTNMNGREFLQNNPFLSARFNLGDYRYTDMLYFGNNAWGIKWYFSVFVRGGLNVFPTRSLVKNIGFDGTGTNGGTTGEFEVAFTAVKPDMFRKESLELEFFNKFVNHFKKENLSLLRRLVKRLKR